MINQAVKSNKTMEQSKIAMKIPKMVCLPRPSLLNTTSHLPTVGKIALTANNLLYLDVDDEYIHQLFPLLNYPQLKKPAYFGEKSAGAHITIIYPEEGKRIDSSDLHQEHSFIVKSACTAEIGLKTYYVLLVESPSLLKLRQRYGLSDMLNFKGYSIEFHITIGVSS